MNYTPKTLPPCDHDECGPTGCRRDGASPPAPCSSPICGNCGKPLKDHYFEDEVYCYLDTNGDIYTEDPREDFVTTLIPPSVWEGYVDQWKRENGHFKTNAEVSHPTKED